MAAQSEREPGGLVMCSCLDPMVQDIPEQDIVMGELELPSQMDPKPEMATAYDASPPLLRNPPPIPAETAQQSALDMILQAMQQMTQRSMDRMDAHTQAFINDARELRGEMRQVGQCLQADKMAAPRATTNELEGRFRLTPYNRAGNKSIFEIRVKEIKNCISK